jgi:hypothetical protein
MKESIKSMFGFLSDAAYASFSGDPPMALTKSANKPSNCQRL